MKLLSSSIYYVHLMLKSIYIILLIVKQIYRYVLMKNDSFHFKKFMMLLHSILVKNLYFTLKR